MFSSDGIDKLMERIISQLGQGTGDLTKSISVIQANGGGRNQSNQTAISTFTPAKVLVILGLLGGY